MKSFYSATFGLIGGEGEKAADWWVSGRDETSLE